MCGSLVMSFVLTLTLAVSFENAFGGELQRFLVFTSQGPLILDMAINIDGKPLGIERERIVREMIATADADQDGKTTWTEAALSGRFEIGALKYLAKKKPVSFRRRLKPLDENENDIVDVDEARRLWALYSGADELISFTSRSFYYRAPSSLAPYLFASLDENQDKQLSADEMKVPCEQIKRQDANDNEILEAREFGTFSKHAYAIGTAIGQQQYATIEKLDDAVSDDVTRYLIGLSEHTSKLPLFRLVASQLDTNQDDGLTVEEITALPKAMAHIVVDVNLGEHSIFPPCRFRSISPKLKQIGSVLTSGSAISLRLDGLKLQILAARNFRDFDIESRTKSMFESLDFDKDGCLELEEVEKSSDVGYAADFVRWDTDDNGRVVLDELTAAYKDQSRQQRRSVTVLNTARVRSLWNWVDINVDGKLSLREMKSMDECLKHSDRNSDGKITTDELPQIVTLRLLPGQTTIPLSGGRLAFGQPFGGQGIGNLPAGPDWFVRMDRNQDGDVSQREFLGKQEQFDHYDKDKDGLIDPVEAKMRE